MNKYVIVLTAFVGGLLIGGVAGYSIDYMIINELNNEIKSLNSLISYIVPLVESMESRLKEMSGKLNETLRELENLSENYQISSNATEYEEKFRWLSDLIYDLQMDGTDKNQKNGYLYDDEHFARDLEDYLEGKGYNVSIIIAFYLPDNLSWDIVLKVTKSPDYFVFVNPQTDGIVTYNYDGNGDGTVETINNPNISTVSLWMQHLVNTSSGNDGEYLLFEFDDYESVKLADTRVYQTYEDLMRDLEEDKTDQQEYVEDTHDCDDFARELEDALEKKGYRVTIKLVYWMEKGELQGHAINDVYLEDGKVVTIEPQTDEDVTSKYDGDGDGSVETAWDVGLIRLNIWLTGFEYWGKWPTRGTDGKYLIFEYDDFDDIPIDLD